MCEQFFELTDKAGRRRRRAYARQISAPFRSKSFEGFKKALCRG